jgi:uncharacterized protein (DUF302 family)
MEMSNMIIRHTVKNYETWRQGFENRGVPARRLFINQVIACCIYPVLPNLKLFTMSAPGVSFRQSKYSVRETIDHLESFLVQHGATIYARVNQEAEVVNSGQNLFPLEFLLLLFGNPVGGGPLMAENPLIALDLPLKVIAWQDDQRKVWLAYNDGAYIEKRYSIPHSPNSALHLDHLIDLALV